MKTKCFFYGLIVLIALTGPAYAAEVFSDNFNDNFFNTSKWSTNINSNPPSPPWGCSGSGLGIWETNNELKAGIDCGWTYALSRNPVFIGSTWTELNFSGRIKFISTGTGVAAINVRKGNSDTDVLSFQYNDWENRLNVYEKNSLRTYRTTPMMPSQYIPFNIVIRRGGYDYYESGNLVFSVASTLFDDATNITPQIGGWDGSHGSTEYAYFDDIKIETKEPTPNIPAPENIETIAAAAISVIVLCSLMARKK